MKLLKSTKNIFYFFLTWFAIHSLIIIIDGLKKNSKSADVAVVLGTKVNEDGTLSLRLIKRLECGLGLYQSHRVKKLIVSGGLGIEGYYEGDKMKEFLVKNGVPNNDIITDNQGYNTRATVLNTLRIMDSLNFKTLIVVSQYFHLTRAKMLFRKKGLKNVSSQSPPYFEIRDFHSVIREFFAFYSQLFL